MPVTLQQRIVDFLLTRIDGFIPPLDLRLRVGPFSETRHYRAVGREFFRFLRDICALKPYENVLDVGCGCGQVAAPLTRYLHHRAIYEGFDIDSQSIEWCQTTISSTFPNFHFHLADIFNKVYNPMGKYSASHYKFPYENESFDLVILKSVFTHMVPHDLENYLSEICRVLRRRGRCIATFFLLNENSLQCIDSKVSTLDFKAIAKDYRTIDETTPEKAIAYDENYIQRIYEKFGLYNVGPVYYGSWPKFVRKNFKGYQDIIVASK